MSSSGPDPQKILENVNNISQDIQRGKSKKFLEDKYSEFKESSPSIFKMVLENPPGFMDGFQRMVEAAVLVKTGQVSQEEMDKKVGLELAKEFIYPNIDMSKEVNEEAGPSNG
jgi:hypothetical protein